MFKFNFGSSDDGTSNTGGNYEFASWLKSKEIIPDDTDKTVKKLVANCAQSSVQYEGIKLKYYSSADVLEILRTNISETSDLNNTLSVINADENHSDLQTAVYEGGLKIWECTYDLLNYIVLQKLDFRDKKVLDLGCGAGLLGILCLVSGAHSCIFQDYNPEILKYITIPNVTLNNEKYVGQSRFFSGDWNSFVDLISTNCDEEKLDYIFTSETIYNVDNYEKLHNAFHKLLKKSGKIYLAAKSYYFGVGGGVSLFTDFLKNKHVFEFTCCWDCPNGLRRQILEINFIE